MITLDNLFTFFEFIAEENTYIQHQPGTTGTTNRFSRFTTESTTGQLSKLGYPRLEVVQLPFGLITDFSSSQQETLTARVRVIYKLSDKFDFDEEVTALDNAKKALFQMLNYIQTAQDECPGNSLLCAFDMNSVRYTLLDKSTFSGSAVGCELSINFKKGICWEEVAYGDFPEYNGTIALPTTAGSYVLRLLNGVYSWVTASAGGVTSVFGRTGAVTAQNGDYTKAQVGLGNVDNTSDADKPVSTAQAAADTAVLNTAAADATTKANTAETNAKSYADGLVVGLWDDRGNYDASGNVFPSSGGSGTAGAILKGDIWTISVAGTLGGVAVAAGDTVRALADSPGQTSSNWALSENNIGYTPENVANKTTTILGNESSTTLYPNVKGVVDWSQSVFQQKNIIATSTVISTHTGDTAETKVASVMIPGGTYAAGNVIRIFARDIKTGTAGAWTPRIRIGTADDLSGTIIYGLTPTASLVNDSCVKTGVIRDISTDTQFGAITVRNDDALTSTGAGFVSYSFNWANDVWIVFSVQNISALDTSGNYYYEITKE